MKRHKTQYPGVFYREVDRIGGRGKERMYYILFKKDGELFEEKVGRQYADDITPARASRVRAERIEGKRLSRKEIREKQKETKDAWTIDKLWTEFREKKNLKGIRIDEVRFNKYLSPKFGNKEPKDLIPLDIERLKIKGLKGKSLQTVKLTLSLLRRIVNYGVKMQLCEPMTFKIEMPTVNNIKTEDLSPTQMKKLLQVIHEDKDPTGASVMLIALYTGMRKNEILGLEWQDVDFERGFISIKNPKSGTDAKIPLNEAARDVFHGILKTESPFVFPGRLGKRRPDIKRTANRIREKADLPKDFRPLHGLRHTYASMLASSGEVDLYTLSKLLTHKDTKMTSRYAHLRDEALRRASNLAGELIKIHEKEDSADIVQKRS